MLTFPSRMLAVVSFSPTQEDHALKSRQRRLRAIPASLFALLNQSHSLHLELLLDFEQGIGVMGDHLYAELGSDPPVITMHFKVGTKIQKKSV